MSVWDVKQPAKGSQRVTGRYWPLPDDYPELSTQGKKEARLSIVCNHQTPRDFVVAVDSFDRWYLETDPLFYPDMGRGKLKSPKFHYDIPHFLASYRRNMLAAPRGSAKSMTLGCKIPLVLLCTRPNFETGLGLATDRMVEGRFDKIMIQLEENKGILNDFGVLKRSGRAGGLWSHHVLRLQNNAKLQGFSVGGRMRGGRPNLFILDDPEYDVDNQTTATKLRFGLEKLLFKIIIPMLEEGSGVFWIGTIIDRLTLIYEAINSTDTRWRMWNRMLLAAADMELDPKTGEPTFTNLLWPEKWPADVLKEKRKEIGSANFSCEYLNAPMSEEERILHVRWEQNGYWVQGPRPDNPAQAEDQTLISYYVKDKDTGEWIATEQQWNKWFKELYRMTFIDYAPTCGPHSDFSCILTLGFDRFDIAWVLGLWLGKVTDDQLLNQIAVESNLWKSHVVCPEAVTIQTQLDEQTAQKLRERGAETGWTPRVIPPKYGGVPKEQRIAALEWRFNQGRLKLPLEDENMDKNPWKTLFQQIQDFTMDLSLLPHDDAVDTLAMMRFVPHRFGTPTESQPEDNTIAGLLKRGITHYPGLFNIPLITGFNTEDLTEEMISGMKGRYTARRGIGGLKKQLARKRHPSRLLNRRWK
jgi:hypothetical protein